MWVCLNVWEQLSFSMLRCQLFCFFFESWIHKSSRKGLMLNVWVWRVLWVLIVKRSSLPQACRCLLLYFLDCLIYFMDIIAVLSLLHIQETFKIARDDKNKLSQVNYHSVILLIIRFAWHIKLKAFAKCHDKRSNMSIIEDSD